MTRSFRPDALAPDRLRRVVAAALAAPSAGFAQGVDLLVLTDPAARERFWAVTTDPAWRERSGSSSGLLCAPALVLPVAEPAAYRRRYAAADKAAALLAGRAPEDWPVPYWLIDAAFAAMLVLLAAEDEGLGALFFQLHREHADVLSDLGLPADRSLIGALALGEPEARQPGASPTRVPRRSAEEALHWESW